MLLCDAQTSGGLLIAVPGDRVEVLKEVLLEAGCLVAAEIGMVKEKEKTNKVINVIS